MMKIPTTAILATISISFATYIHIALDRAV